MNSDEKQEPKLFLLKSLNATYDTKSSLILSISSSSISELPLPVSLPSSTISPQKILDWYTQEVDKVIWIDIPEFHAYNLGKLLDQEVQGSELIFQINGPKGVHGVYGAASIEEKDEIFQLIRGINANKETQKVEAKHDEKIDKLTFAQTKVLLQQYHDIIAESYSKIEMYEKLADQRDEEMGILISEFESVQNEHTKLHDKLSQSISNNEDLKRKLHQYNDQASSYQEMLNDMKNQIQTNQETIWPEKIKEMELFYQELLKKGQEYRLYHNRIKLLVIFGFLMVFVLLLLYINGFF